MKNSKGGKKTKKCKNTVSTKRELIYKSDGEEYAKVIKMLGDSRVSVLCCDNVTRLATIRGSMKKRVWINVGDTLLVSLRDYQDEKADVLHKYNPDEVKALKIYKDASIDNNNIDNDKDSDYIDFCYNEQEIIEEQKVEQYQDLDSENSDLDIDDI
jgi:translation initiation factor 1A